MVLYTLLEGGAPIATTYFSRNYPQPPPTNTLLEISENAIRHNLDNIYFCIDYHSFFFFIENLVIC